MAVEGLAEMFDGGDEAKNALGGLRLPGGAKRRQFFRD
jgi:hypothetical protein